MNRKAGIAIALFCSLVIAFALTLIPTGCSTFHEPTPTTTLPARTFVGVSLGDSTAAVITALGQPDAIYSEFDELIYEYDSKMRAVVFQKPTEEVIGVISANSNDRLGNLRVGIHADYAKQLLGDPDRAKTGDITYMWLYDRYNISLSFYNSNDACVGVVLYWPGRFDIDPE